MPESGPHWYPTHIQSHNHYHHMCICEGVGTQKWLKLTIIYQHLTTFILWTSTKALETLSYVGMKSLQVLHTYSVSEQLPSYVYLWRSRHPKITRICGYIVGLDHFYALNFRQSVSITDLCRNQVHTGTPHTFCLTTTSLTCVSICYLVPNRHQKIAVGDNEQDTTELTSEGSNITYDNAWLTAMNQRRRCCPARFLTSYMTPPRMSRNGHHKTTCDHGECKRHVKPRNLMSVASCECVVGGN